MTTAVSAQQEPAASMLTRGEEKLRFGGVLLFSFLVLGHRILERQGMSSGAIDLAVCAGAGVVGFLWPVGAVVGVLGSTMIGETAAPLGVSLSLWLRVALAARLAVDLLARRVPLARVTSGTFRYWLPFALVVLASYIVVGSSAGASFIVKFSLTAVFVAGCVVYIRGVESLRTLQIGLVVIGLVSAAWGILHVASGGWRSGGLEENPNYGAMYLCTAFFLALGFLDGVGLPKVLSLAAVVCVPLGILASGSRGATVVMLFGTFAYVLLFGRSGRRFLRVAGFSVVVGVLILAVLPQFIRHSRILETLGNLLGGSTVDPTTGREIDRLHLWRDSIRLWLGHPVLGVGPQNWFEARTIGAVERRSAHMYFLQIFAELGTLGGLAYVHFLLRSFRDAVRRVRRMARPLSEFLTAWVAAGLAMAASVFSGNAYSPYLNAVIVIATSAALTLPYEPPDAMSPPPGELADSTADSLSPDYRTV